MADHSELIAEIASVEKMNTPERLKHAKKRRSQQLKRFANYEKQLEKDKNKKNKASQNSQKRQQKRGRRVKFIHNIMLLESAARNDLEEVRNLLRRNVNPDVTNEDGLTALHQCCIDDNEEMLRLLLDYGANVNARDSEMWTPLHAAATCGHVHLCKILIDKGADLLAVNADGNMPYDICEDEVALDYIEIEMAKRGITQEEIDEKRLETEKQMLADLKHFAKEGRRLEYRDKNGATPLHVAAANGYLDVVEFLLDQHVSMEVRDEDGWMPIHAAACWLQPEVIELLVKNGADLEAKTRNGEKPFDLAEDPDVKQKILDLKDELETHRASRSKDPVRNRRTNTRGHYSSTSSLYSSNGSLNEKPQQQQHGSSHRSASSEFKQSLSIPSSASIRRTSMRGEKRPLFKKEAKEEALHFGVYGNMAGDDDDVDPMEDKENVPATNIDDVKISFLDEDEIDNNKHVNNVDTDKKTKPAPPENKSRNSRELIRDTHPPKETVVNSSAARSPTEGSQKQRRPDSSGGHKQEPDKSSPRNSHEPEPIHIKYGGNASDSQKKEPSPRPTHDKEPSPRPAHESKRVREASSQEKDTISAPPTSVVQNPQMKQVQAQSGGVGRTPSFTKRRDSRKKTADGREPSPDKTEGGGSNVRYPSGTGTGTLADLKKHRAEQQQIKFSNNLDATVANLFLQGLSTDSKKYSSSSGGGGSNTPPSNKEAARNGRNNNNNNNVPGQSRQQTYISDNGALRRFSGPTSPVIGDDDKFKSNCCVIL